MPYKGDSESRQKYDKKLQNFDRLYCNRKPMRTELLDAIELLKYFQNVHAYIDSFFAI